MTKGTAELKTIYPQEQELRSWVGGQVEGREYSLQDLGRVFNYWFEKIMRTGKEMVLDMQMGTDPKPVEITVPGTQDLFDEEITMADVYDGLQAVVVSANKSVNIKQEPLTQEDLRIQENIVGNHLIRIFLHALLSSRGYAGTEEDLNKLVDNLMSLWRGQRKGGLVVCDRADLPKIDI